MKFRTWLETKDPTFYQDPLFANARGFVQLNHLFNQYQNRMVRFKDETGATLVGKLVDLLDEGMFVIRTNQGEHEVPAQHIISLQ